MDNELLSSVHGKKGFWCGCHGDAWDLPVSTRLEGLGVPEEYHSGGRATDTKDHFQHTFCGDPIIKGRPEMVPITSSRWWMARKI